MASKLYDGLLDDFFANAKADGLLTEDEARAAAPAGAAPGEFAGSAAALEKQLPGQADYLKALEKAFRRPELLGHIDPAARNCFLIWGRPGSGRHTGLTLMAGELFRRHLLPGGQVAALDLALYPGPAQEKLFLQDLYAALEGPGRVVSFDHLSAGSPACLQMLAALVQQGRIPLGARYVLQRGVLVDAGSALVGEAVRQLTPKGKYLVFFNEKGPDALAALFGAPFVDALGDVCVTAEYAPETRAAIAAGALNELAQKAKAKLGLLVQAGAEVRDWVAAGYLPAVGIPALLERSNRLYRALAEYTLQESPRAGSTAALSLAEGEPVFSFGEKAAIPLSALLPAAQGGLMAQARAQLNGLTGLASVKDYLNALADNVVAQQKRRAAGLPTVSLSMHTVFTGNPGTGKTTVARILAQYLKAAGVLRGGQLVEVTRADLVGRYVGHTAPLVNQVVGSALGGVLFIDEAYSLCRGTDDSFGLEAVDTLVKAMEDHRDDLVVVLAGYTKEMTEFLQSNSGLASRFPNQIEFPDYTPEELWAITEGQAKAKGYTLDPGCKMPLMAVFTRRQAEDPATAGNGRLARNLLEKAILNQSRRLAAEPQADLSLLLPGDFPAEG